MGVVIVSPQKQWNQHVRMRNAINSINHFGKQVHSFIFVWLQSCTLWWRSHTIISVVRINIVDRRTVNKATNLESIWYIVKYNATVLVRIEIDKAPRKNSEIHCDKKNKRHTGNSNSIECKWIHASFNTNNLKTNNNFNDDLLNLFCLWSVNRLLTYHHRWEQHF